MRYLRIDEKWLTEEIERLLAEMRKLRKMRSEGKKQDKEGVSLFFQILELKIELKSLKKVLKHAVEIDQKEAGKG